MNEFAIFKDLILKEYKSKKKRGVLHTKLEHPSPANLRDYALYICNKGLSKNDEKVFLEYFNSNGKDDVLEKSIKNIDTTKLKSVQNFLRGRTKSPDEHIVKLVAILIDFEPRPFALWKQKYLVDPSPEIESLFHDNTNIEYDINDKKVIANRNEIQNVNDSITFTEKKENLISELPKKRNIKKMIGWSLATISVASTSYFFISNINSNECMYWDGEKYERIDCKENKTNKNIIVARDNDLNNFRKITRPDTLTEEHELKVWYFKRNNFVEFFTAPGYHPVYTQKILKPATWYMINKYRNVKPSNDIYRKYRQP